MPHRAYGTSDARRCDLCAYPLSPKNRRGRCSRHGQSKTFDGATGECLTCSKRIPSNHRMSHAREHERHRRMGANTIRSRSKTWSVAELARRAGHSQAWVRLRLQRGKSPSLISKWRLGLDWSGLTIAGVNVVGIARSARESIHSRGIFWKCLCRCGASFTATDGDFVDFEGKSLVLTCGCGGDKSRPRMMVFGQSVTMRELAQLSVRSETVLRKRMSVYGMTAEHAAFGPDLPGAVRCRNYGPRA